MSWEDIVIEAYEAYLNNQDNEKITNIGPYIIEENSVLFFRFRNSERINRHLLCADCMMQY